MKKLFVSLSLFVLLVAPVVSQDWTMDPTYEDLYLEEFFTPDPTVVEILAGGAIDLALSSVLGLPRSATGFVAMAPDLDLYYITTGTMSLTIRVRGYGEDTVLLVNDPDGRWFFNDDSPDFEDGGFLDPSITFNRPISGLYSIWVGTFSTSELVPVDLEITELH